MAKERVRSFRYRAKSDQGNFRMRWLRYFMSWALEQSSRLGITQDELYSQLRAGATFENIEAIPTPEAPDPDPEPTPT